MLREGYSPEQGLNIQVSESENDPVRAIVDVYIQLRKKGYERADAKTMIVGLLEKKFPKVGPNEVDRILTEYAANKPLEQISIETEIRQDRQAA